MPPDAKAVVLHGTARAFSGGADITEFGKPGREPNLRQVIAAIEEMPMPVVAAIQGVALGGGLELALGCHARVAWAGARLGLPEVKLGLLPGGGGTQRLPRIAGVEKALQMIVTRHPGRRRGGGPHGPGRRAAGRQLSRRCRRVGGEATCRVAGCGTGRTRCSRRKDDPGLIDRVAAPLLKASGGRSAAPVRRGGARRRDDAVRRGAPPTSAALFEQLVAGDESRAQRHAFFAEREAQKAQAAGRHHSRAR